jgi:2-dehydro-3-deoxygluconokinase
MVKKTLLAVGETMAMVTPETVARLAEADRFRMDAGGAESNVAAHVAALGHSAQWFSRLGADALGNRILAQLGARGIDTARVIRDGAHQTGLYVKDPGHGVAYYRRGSAASHLSTADADELSLDGVDVLHLSGITAAISESAAAFLDRVIGRAHDAGVPVSFDVNHRAALWSEDVAAPVLAGFARRADLVLTGRDEAEGLWGAATDDDIRGFFSDVPELVVKDGDVGATAYLGDARVFEPALVVEVVEVVGAGDAFAGGYLASRLSGDDPAARLRAGHARAALTLRTTGDFIEEGLQP